MAQIGSRATGKLVVILNGSNGLSASLAQVSALAGIPAPQIDTSQITTMNLPPDIGGRSTMTRYPDIHVYCTKVTNSLLEKFRTFSGQAEMVIEARLSHDRIEALDPQVQMCVDAITDVLDSARGDWGDGFFYGGKYEVSYGPVKHGGRNFLQIAKVTCEVEASE